MVGSDFQKLASKELTFALDICQQAGLIAMKHLNVGVSATMKADHSPVTIADRECERLIREAIAGEFPDDTILGEEEGQSRAHLSLNQRKWIIDPIDGTYAYVRRTPFFSTLLALEENGEVVMGVVHAPAVGDTFWAQKGNGAYKNGERIKVSDIKDIKSAQFNFGAINRILKEGYWTGFTRLVETTYWQRGMGDYLNFAQVFEGKAEASVEVGLKPWDLAPMKVLVEEAGGRFSDLEGGQSIYSGGCLISNGHLHDELLQVFLSK